MKILMSAYACEPNRGSEPAVGWNWAVQAARFQEIWVLTRGRYRFAIELELMKNPQPRLHFIYHDLPEWLHRWQRAYLFENLYFRAWQVSAIRLGRRWHKRVGFDLGHHVTYVSFRHPSMLAWLGIPYVWGPIGGGDTAPRGFYQLYGFKGIIRELLRVVSNVIPLIDPMVRRTARQATKILVVTPATQAVLPRSVWGKVELAPAIGHVGATTVKQDYGRVGALRLIFVGNLLYLKGLQLALPALARANRSSVHITLTVVGDGPYGRDLKELANRLGISDYVNFNGRLSPDEVHRAYQRHDALVFPSFTDSGGFVVLEAMAAGLPVVCLNLGGPAITVTSETGYRIDASNPEQVVADMAASFLELAINPELRQTMGQKAQVRVVTQYEWDRTGEHLHEMYSSILGEFN